MDLFILKTDVEKFTSTNKKTLHLIFKLLYLVSLRAVYLLIVVLKTVIFDMLPMVLLPSGCVMIISGATCIFFSVQHMFFSGANSS